MRAVLSFACVVGISLFHTGQIAAEPSKVVSWLMDNPLTLWDRGIIILEEAADRVTSNVAKETADAFAEVAYDWDHNEIRISLYMVDFKGDLSHEKCNEWRAHFINEIFRLRLAREHTQVRRAMLIVRISTWFSHKGFSTKGRDKNLGEKLARIIFVQTMLRTGDDAIICRERVTEFDAPSKQPA